MQKLSALRRAHQLASHRKVKNRIRAKGKEKARQLTVRQWVNIVRDLEANG